MPMAALWLAATARSFRETEVPGEHCQRCHKHPLRLRRRHRSATPSPSHGPLADRALEADHVPDAATRRAARATQHVQCCGDLTTSLHLPLGHGLARRGRQADQSSTPQPI